jgi:hypothetical protein
VSAFRRTSGTVHRNVSNAFTLRDLLEVRPRRSHCVTADAHQKRNDVKLYSMNAVTALTTAGSRGADPTAAASADTIVGIASLSCAADMDAIDSRAGCILFSASGEIPPKPQPTTIDRERANWLETYAQSGS